MKNSYPTIHPSHTPRISLLGPHSVSFRIKSHDLDHSIREQFSVQHCYALLKCVYNIGSICTRHRFFVHLQRPGPLLDGHLIPSVFIAALFGNIVVIFFESNYGISLSFLLWSKMKKRTRSFSVDSIPTYLPTYLPTCAHGRRLSQSVGPFTEQYDALKYSTLGVPP